MELHLGTDSDTEATETTERTEDISWLEEQ